MFHREGFRIITVTFLIVIAITIGSDYYLDTSWVKKTVQAMALIFLVLVLQFLETPKDHLSRATHKSLPLPMVKLLL